MSILGKTSSLGRYYCFSNRVIVAGYAGDGFKVRRSSDNTVQNIGYTGTTIGSPLDVDALNTFLNGSLGYVVAPIAQEGEAWDDIPTASQPRIGQHFDADGLPVLTFDGVDDYLLSSTGSYGWGSQYIKGRFTLDSSIEYILGGASDSNRFALITRDENNIDFGLVGGVNPNFTAVSDPTMGSESVYSWTASQEAGTAEYNLGIYNDGTLLGSRQTITCFGATGLRVGSTYDGGGFFASMQIGTLIHIGAEFHDDDERSAVEDQVANLAPAVPKGTVRFNDVNFSNGVVDWFAVSAPTQGALDTTWIEQSSISSGIASMATARDATKDYFGVARGMTQDFTGTLTAVAGTTLSTGLNLTGVSIGGVNDDHYIFRATAGAGAGEEVTVLSRTGGDIVVNNNPGFDATTEFTLGRFVRGISKVFPKD